MKLVENNKFDDALAMLKEAELKDPKDVDIKLEMARIYSWQKRFPEAQAKVDEAKALQPSDPDVGVVASYLDYYQGDYAQAEKGFDSVLRNFPAYNDAAEGLKEVTAAEKEKHGFDWLIDAGYEHSSFARRPVSDWDNEFLQVTRLLDDGKTALHARFEYYDQFNTSDAYYEVGADHSFAPFLNAYLYEGHTVDAAFRPTWRTQTGGSVRLNEPSVDRPNVWLELDLREEDYRAASFLTVDPGVKVEMNDWSLYANLVSVKQWGTNTVFGYNTRIDTPAWNNVRLYAGYSYAPDVENAVADYTSSIYGGAAYDINDAYTLHLGYTHDDRQNSYIRHVVDASITLRY